MDNMNMQYKLYWCLRNESAPVVGLLMYFTLCVFMYNNNHRCSCVRATHITHSLHTQSLAHFQNILLPIQNKKHIYGQLWSYIYTFTSHNTWKSHVILTCLYMGYLCLIYTNIGKVTTVINIPQQDLYFPCFSWATLKIV